MRSAPLSWTGWAFPTPSPSILMSFPRTPDRPRDEQGDMMVTQSGAERQRCPECHEPVRPDSAFCGNCGASLSGMTTSDVTDDADDDQLTTTFVPVSSHAMDTDYQPDSEPSPWASPDSAHYTPPSPPIYDQASDSNPTAIDASPPFS